jgi:hypothetical protein
MKLKDNVLRSHNVHTCECADCKDWRFQTEKIQTQAFIASNNSTTNGKIILNTTNTNTSAFELN